MSSWWWCRPHGVSLRVSTKSGMKMASMAVVMTDAKKTMASTASLRRWCRGVNGIAASMASRYV